MITSHKAIGYSLRLNFIHKFIYKDGLLKVGHGNQGLSFFRQREYITDQWSPMRIPHSYDKSTPINDDRQL